MSIRLAFPRYSSSTIIPRVTGILKHVPVVQNELLYSHRTRRALYSPFDHRSIQRQRYSTTLGPEPSSTNYENENESSSLTLSSSEADSNDIAEGLIPSSPLQSSDLSSVMSNDLLPEPSSDILSERNNNLLPEPNSNLPWYLRPSSSTTDDPSNHSLPQIPLPPLPLNSPPLLFPLLTHLSSSLSQSNLSILDLRALSTPSGLGASLIMLLATSRSERHLHSSADKLCRWLRSEHDIKPFADGLLGRGELKIQKRRALKKAGKRSRLGGVQDDVGDGVDRNGWVCVNIGRVLGGEYPVDKDVGGKEEETEDKGRFVGFREEVGGSRIVVQMMTEEKRGILDLEGLWLGILHRQKKESHV